MKVSVEFVLFCAVFLPIVMSQKLPKIVNGSNADIAEFPFLVSIRYKSSHSCAGSLLNDLWIVTAAHCLFAPVEEMSIEFGTTEISDGFKGSKVVEIERYVINEGWDPYQIRNDIGLIKLKNSLDTNLYGSPVRLAVPGKHYPTGTPTTVAGWGRVGSDLPISTVLQKVELQIYSFEDCRAALKENIYDIEVHRTNICAGVPEMGKAECNGDSGGPLLVNGVQVGIVSWSVKPCAIAPYPGVYTDISQYIGWIAEVTGINFDLDTFLIRKLH